MSSTRTADRAAARTTLSKMFADYDTDLVSTLVVNRRRSANGTTSCDLLVLLVNPGGRTPVTVSRTVAEVIGAKAVRTTEGAWLVRGAFGATSPGAALVDALGVQLFGRSGALHHWPL